MSRALGDWQYKSGKLPVKEMAVSSFPDIKQFKIEKDTKYLVTACDGIWDVLSNQVCIINIYNFKSCFLNRKENCRKKIIIIF